jgi:hypothetical protein
MKKEKVVSQMKTSELKNYLSKDRGITYGGAVS